MSEAAQDRARAAQLPECDLIRILLEQHTAGPFASVVDRTRDASKSVVS